MPTEVKLTHCMRIDILPNLPQSAQYHSDMQISKKAKLKSADVLRIDLLATNATPASNVIRYNTEYNIAVELRLNEAIFYMLIIKFFIVTY